MTKLLLLDKDGTLVRPTHGEFVDAPWHQELLPNVKKKLQQMSDDGWAIAICSNQGGVAAGHKTIENCADEMIYALELTGICSAMAAHSFEEQHGEALFFDRGVGGVTWKVVTSDQHRFRKPGTGMIEHLAVWHRGQKWRSFGKVLFVGDRPEDEGAAKAAGVSFQWAKEFFEWTN